MTEVVIVEAVRTAIGKMGGALKDVEVDFLAAKVIGEVLRRSGIDGNDVDEVIMGQAKQSTDAPNMARVALLRAGLPVEVPGYTVHRQCGSGLQAINNAAQQIQCGLANIVVAGGAESMSTAPYYIRGVRYGLEAGNGQLLDPNTESQPRSQPPEVYGRELTMGMTAENLAEQYGISREEQDEFAFLSQSRAAYAISSGKFKEEIVPYEIRGKKETIRFEVDEHPRLTPVEKLLTLPAVFKKGGTVTAGNSSGRNDGASAVLVMSEAEAQKRGLRPKARILAQAVSGVSPEIMGIGPVPSTHKALQMAGLALEDIDLIELNEAFAAQSLAVIKELGVGLEKVNVNGGAIALGHPLGATGAILMTKLLSEMERRGSRYGLVTLCIGGGQGITTIVENLRS
ncbi:thiolase family protein [Effusibacillus lacus]|uniref:acetyl-CoA C-acetyltransferase n=1 Tax=Effusibacillus lacus TaxID=1348429 RepID=A0A292YLV1_9BACL|nr:thiolase family protein [Effusibacillus lacus]TCS71641.1 acetyl-CoA C-acetyltransferase [Effusibacillus lacus]GAX90146.1 acetyl-CoA acetyltransferase [Effusibacillus lacus]